MLYIPFGSLGSYSVLATKSQPQDNPCCTIRTRHLTSLVRHQRFRSFFGETTIETVRRTIVPRSRQWRLQAASHYAMAGLHDIVATVYAAS
jgi:hypothetical protein